MKTELLIFTPEFKRKIKEAQRFKKKAWRHFQFKKGDVVKIKVGFYRENIKNSPHITSSMIHREGGEYVITSRMLLGEDFAYTLQGSEALWREEWLERPFNPKKLLSDDFQVNPF